MEREGILPRLLLGILMADSIIFAMGHTRQRPDVQWNTSHKDKGHKGTQKGFSGNSFPMVPRDGSTRSLREIPEAMLDPYSVLGVLSFGVYIFYILYTRYRMRGHHPPNAQNQLPPPPPNQGAGTLFSADAQENIANIIKMATNIISNSPYTGMSNSTLDGDDDYFDAIDGADLKKKSSKK